MIKLRRKRSLGWALTQNDWCPNKKGRFAHSQTSHVKAVPVKPQGKKLPEAGREAHNTPFLSIFGRSMEPLPPSSWSWTFGLQQWDNTFLFWPSFESWEYSIYLLCVKKKDHDAGQNWRQEEKGMTEDEMVGWHHWLDGHEFEYLACCSPWGCKELDTTEHLDWLTEHIIVTWSY